MALTPQIRASQFYVTGVTGGASPGIQASQYSVTAVVNFPTENVQVSSLVTTAVTSGGTPSLEVAQFYITAVVRGRVDNHRVRAWSFSLDGHDFYVLQLGESGTIIWDMATGQWAQWKSPDRTMWRACLGQNWTGVGQGALTTSGTRTNIVAGDDAFGLLWFLAPQQGYDEAPDDASEQPFGRVAMGGLPMRMRQTVRCNEVYVLGSKGVDAIASAAQTITLRTSDDAEKTWLDQGTITIVPDEWDAEFAWRSLGVIGAPGRVFEISDNCLSRLDGMEIR